MQVGAPLRRSGTGAGTACGCVEPFAMHTTASPIMQATPPLTVADAATTLGVSERTVWRYLRSGRLQGQTVGPAGAQRTMIDPEGVQAIVRSGRQEVRENDDEAARAMTGGQGAQRTAKVGLPRWCEGAEESE